MTYLPPISGGRINITMGGNTAGAGALVSSGTLTLAGGNNITLSQNGNAITISGGAGGAGGGIALANSQATYTSGTAHLNVAGGAMTIASTTGQSFNFSVPQTSSLEATGAFSISTNGNTISMGVPAFSAGMSNIGNTSGTTGLATNQLVLAGGNNITLSQSTAAGGNTISISAGAGGGAATGSYFDNMFQQNSVQAITYTSVSTGMFGRVIVQPLAPGNELFPYDMTASTLLLGFSNSGSSLISAAHSSSWYVGLYTRVNSTQLSLLNSATQSYAMAANIGNSASYMGARWLSIHSSQFSSQPVLRAGSRYFFAILARTSGTTYASISMAGMHLGQSVQRSGLMAAAVSSHTSYNAWHPFMGVHSLTTHTALPATIANSDINKATAYANFIPQVVFDAGLGAVN